MYRPCTEIYTKSTVYIDISWVLIRLLPVTPYIVDIATINIMVVERSGDFFARTTSILQFSSEMQQTWHFYCGLKT
jgi:hypothetical protein